MRVGTGHGGGIGVIYNTQDYSHPPLLDCYTATLDLFQYLLLASFTTPHLIQTGSSLRIESGYVYS